MPPQRLLQVAVQEQPCHFLRIPAELRLKIYRFLFKCEYKIYLNRSHFRWLLTPLRTCRLIYREASDVFYRENTFTVKCHDFGDHHYFDSLNVVTSRSIYRLHLVVFPILVHYDAHYIRDIVRSLQSGHRLKELTITYDDLDCTATEVDERMSLFKDVKVRGKVTIKPYRAAPHAETTETAMGRLIQSMRRKREATSQI